MLMPDEEEVRAFTASTDSGARKAAAAVAFQQAYRLYRHRQAIKVCLGLEKPKSVWRFCILLTAC